MDNKFFFVQRLGLELADVLPDRGLRDLCDFADWTREELFEIPGMTEEIVEKVRNELLRVGCDFKENRNEHVLVTQLYLPDLPFTDEALLALQFAGFKTPDELSEMTRNDVQKATNLSDNAMSWVEAALQVKGFSFKDADAKMADSSFSKIVPLFPAAH